MSDFIGGSTAHDAAFYVRDWHQFDAPGNKYLLLIVLRWCKLGTEFNRFVNSNQA